ncbi:DUF86 domain-containing protein [candidate division KSB1 bacterium]|nr:DUF86 domain-containing protein [candidate division KSB1 bacterium]NIR71846.1 DUF86 domain-containing protein [candidate division KSB1 bacterium]NIS25362.1 DUF86 domain-containing protein [candidate division KSB1 bacterium]NIT71832.1 DUF86 domain-containing protein [candidate division KSB1 bacterium]NIU25570.1 DUF86 domain-containing protein [candidate division KSB1 bacterium]
MLVHLYWEIDAEKVFEILNSHLSDFEKYASHIAKFLKNQQENSS